MTNNVLVVAWSPLRFAGLEHFVVQTDALLEFVRSSRLKDGVAEIRLPGDRSRRLREQRRQHGIPVDNAIWQRLTDLGAELGVGILPMESSE